MSLIAYLKPHFQFSMLLLMPLLWVLWHDSRGTLMAKFDVASVY